ncbi:hypothetical protein [Solirhodobacter olei]|uniref:hypothetical protein n=1 Tax=Solirhodobacter olei TaxID=2493082 RepID=UPI000FD8BDB0|nr:hypothetical protein [Solirhodobacter olei]
MTIPFTDDHLATIEDLRTKGERVFVHLDIYGRVIRIDRHPPGNWIAPTYEIDRNGGLRLC